MAKAPTSDQIMPADQMKPLLALSKREPVSAAIGLASDGEAVLLLDKKMKPKRVLATLKASATKSKVSLQPSTLRFGRAEVDPDYDANMVRFFVSREAPGNLRIRLVEILKKIGYGKVEINVDATLEEEGEEEQAEEDVTASESAPSAPPDAPPPPPQADAKAALHEALAALIRRIPAAAGEDAARKAMLLKAAGAANDALKTDDMKLAAATIGKLKQVLEALTPHSPTESKAAPLLPVWLEAKETVDERLGRMQGALREFDDPDLNRIAEMGLNGVTGRSSVGLMAALREADAAGGGAEPRAKLAEAIASYRSFLDGDPIVGLLDDNPFGVELNLRATLWGALDTLSQRIAA
jgi:hypothetical protein